MQLPFHKNHLMYALLLVISIAFLIRVFFNRSKSGAMTILSSKGANALVLSCMDYRFVDDSVYFFNRIGYRDDYNQFSLAGASLGYNQTQFPEWRETCNKHIELAMQLHDINEVIVMDHMDCGAYRILYDSPSMSRQEEYELHKKNLNKFKTMINQKFPALTVTTHLMDVDGSVMI
jgi:carbonic anhydrase